MATYKSRTRLKEWSVAVAVGVGMVLLSAHPVASSPTQTSKSLVEFTNLAQPVVTIPVPDKAKRDATSTDTDTDTAIPTLTSAWWLNLFPFLPPHIQPSATGNGQAPSTTSNGGAEVEARKARRANEKLKWVPGKLRPGSGTGGPHAGGDLGGNVKAEKRTHHGHHQHDKCDESGIVGMNTIRVTATVTTTITRAPETTSSVLLVRRHYGEDNGDEDHEDDGDEGESFGAQESTTSSTPGSISQLDPPMTSYSYTSTETTETASSPQSQESKPPMHPRHGIVKGDYYKRSARKRPRPPPPYSIDKYKGLTPTVGTGPRPSTATKGYGPSSAFYKKRVEAPTLVVSTPIITTVFTIIPTTVSLDLQGKPVVEMHEVKTASPKLNQGSDNGSGGSGSPAVPVQQNNDHTFDEDEEDNVDADIIPPPEHLSSVMAEGNNSNIIATIKERNVNGSIIVAGTAGVDQQHYNTAAPEPATTEVPTTVVLEENKKGLAHIITAPYPTTTNNPKESQDLPVKVQIHKKPDSRRNIRVEDDYFAAPLTNGSSGLNTGPSARLLWWTTALAMTILLFVSGGYASPQAAEGDADLHPPSSSGHRPGINSGVTFPPRPHHRRDDSSNSPLRPHLTPDGKLSCQEGWKLTTYAALGGPKPYNLVGKYLIDGQMCVRVVDPSTTSKSRRRHQPTSENPKRRSPDKTMDDMLRSFRPHKAADGTLSCIPQDGRKLVDAADYRRLFDALPSWLLEQLVVDGKLCFEVKSIPPVPALAPRSAALLSLSNLRRGVGVGSAGGDGEGDGSSNNTHHADAPRRQPQSGNANAVVVVIRENKDRPMSGRPHKAPDGTLSCKEEGFALASYIGSDPPESVVDGKLCVPVKPPPTKESRRKVPDAVAPVEPRATRRPHPQGHKPPLRPKLRVDGKDWNELFCDDDGYHLAPASDYNIEKDEFEEKVVDGQWCVAGEGSGAVASFRGGNSGGLLWMSGLVMAFLFFFTFPVGRSHGVV